MEPLKLRTELKLCFSAIAYEMCRTYVGIQLRFSKISVVSNAFILYFISKLFGNIIESNVEQSITNSLISSIVHALNYPQNSLRNNILNLTLLICRVIEITIPAIAAVPKYLV